jgi:hypothetical protein
MVGEKEMTVSPYGYLEELTDKDNQCVVAIQPFNSGTGSHLTA